MSISKYRLAPPIDNDETDLLYQPSISILFSPRPRLTILNNVETSTNKALLDKKQKIGETVPFISTTRWWLVLPYLFLVTLVLASDPLLMNDLIVHRYKRRYGLDTSSNAQGQVCRQPTTTPMPNIYWQFPPYNRQPPQGRSDYNMVQRDAARFNMKMSLITLIPALVTFILLGSNCDFIGRRPLLVLPLFGKVISYSLMLVIVSRDLSDAWILATQAIEEVFGSIGLVMLSTFAYITDCTHGSIRTRAFLLTEGLMVLTRVISMLAVGIWLRFYLYTTPFSVCLALSVIALLYALFVLPESVESV